MTWNIQPEHFISAHHTQAILKLVYDIGSKQCDQIGRFTVLWATLQNLQFNHNHKQCDQIGQFIGLWGTF